MSATDPFDHVPVYMCESCGQRDIANERYLHYNGVPLIHVSICRRCAELSPSIVLSSIIFMLRTGRPLPAVEQFLKDGKIPARTITPDSPPLPPNPSPCLARIILPHD